MPRIFRPFPGAGGTGLAEGGIPGQSGAALERDYHAWPRGLSMPLDRRGLMGSLLEHCWLWTVAAGMGKAAVRRDELSYFILFWGTGMGNCQWGGRR